MEGLSIPPLCQRPESPRLCLPPPLPAALLPLPPPPPPQGPPAVGLHVHPEAVHHMRFDIHHPLKIT